MLRSLKGIEGYIVSATDGDIGSVVNFFLDDEHWTVRYLTQRSAEWKRGAGPTARGLPILRTGAYFV